MHPVANKETCLHLCQSPAGQTQPGLSLTVAGSSLMSVTKERWFHCLDNCLVLDLFIYWSLGCLIIGSPAFMVPASCAFACLSERLTTIPPSSIGAITSVGEQVVVVAVVSIAG
jgi:hypothetical protein